jgi:putative MATE family efflux protein
VKDQLTDGPALRRLVSFGLPLVVGTVAHSLFNLVDVWLVGRFSPSTMVNPGGAPGSVGREAALAAIHASSVLNFLPMIVAQGVSVATIATVSRAVGARNSQRAADVVNRSLLVAVLLGAVLGVVTGLTSGWQIDALNVSAEARPTAVRCLEVLSYGSITMFTLLQVTAIERAAGRSIPPLVVLTGANLLNAAVAFYAVPRWGAVGAAYATVVCRGLFAVIGVLWLYKRFPELRVHIGKLAEIWTETWDLLRVGMPASLQIFSRALAVLLVTRLLTNSANGLPSETESTDVLAAYSVALRLEMIAMFACVGWGTAAAAAVGQNIGAGKLDRAIRMGWIGSAIAASSMVALGAAFYFFAPSIFPFFLEDEHKARLGAIVHYGTEYFRIVAFAYAGVGIGIVLAEAVNGAGATRVSFLVDFLAYVVLLSTLAIGLQWAYGRKGLWIALVVVHGVVALVYMAIFRRVLTARGVKVHA